jgi:hypothetical protein
MRNMTQKKNGEHQISKDYLRNPNEQTIGVLKASTSGIENQ